MDIYVIIVIGGAIARVRKRRSTDRIIIYARIVSANRGRSNIEQITIAINAPSISTIKHLIKLCNYYKVSADYILGLKNKAP
jgi:ribosomal protein L7Ae-like RNA K-turn-binding protein